MLKLELSVSKDQPLKVLCLGAHSDDIEIGCGGTVLRLLDEYSNLQIYWIVFGSGGQRGSEARKSAKLFLEKAKQKVILIKNFRDSYFPYLGAQVKEYFEQLKSEISPDIILTHHRNDLHQDHRFISDLTWQTFRDNLILEYEIPKYDGDFGSPNYFVHLDEEICERKILYLMRSFATQKMNHWFNEETFRGILRLRGVESNAPSKHAEAFYSRKIVC